MSVCAHGCSGRRCSRKAVAVIFVPLVLEGEVGSHMLWSEPEQMDFPNAFDLERTAQEPAQCVQ